MGLSVISYYGYQISAISHPVKPRQKALSTLEGRGAQKGERMTYRREGGRLIFTGDFIHDGKPVRDREIFTRAGD